MSLKVLDAQYEMMFFRNLKKVVLFLFFRPKRTLNSKKYGVDLIHFTHATNTAIHSSTKVDGKFSRESPRTTLRFLSGLIARSQRVALAHPLFFGARSLF